MSLIEDGFDKVEKGIVNTFGKAHKAISDSFYGLSDGIVNIYCLFAGFSPEAEERRLGVKAEGMSYVPEFAEKFKAKIDEYSEVTDNPTELGDYAFLQVYSDTDASDRDSLYKLSLIRWLDRGELYHTVMSPRKAAPQEVAQPDAPQQGYQIDPQLLQAAQERNLTPQQLVDASQILQAYGRQAASAQA